jgi:hypothetical protein
MTPRLARALVLATLACAAVPAFADEVAPPPPPPPTAPGGVVIRPAPRVYRRRPGPRVMAPLEIDIGATGANTMLGFAPGIAGSIGIHWASLSPQPTDTDVGIGVFGALMATPAPADPNMSSGVAYGGAYLDFGHTLTRGDFARTWASARGEYLESSAFGATRVGFGASVRLSAELYTSGIGIAPGQLFLGSYAVGLYAEAGVRHMVEGVGDFQATAGLTFRTPLVFSVF